jgi:outer membrane biosynthesis protein TonB
VFDAMSPGWRISPALLAAIAAAALSFGVSFAVVADATKTGAPDRVAARPVTQATPAQLALTSAPSLRVRQNVLPPPAAPVQAASEPATPAAPAPQQTTTEQTPGPQTQTQEQAPTTSTPAPTPKPKPKPKAKPKPKPSGPDFDDSGPQGP